MKRFAYLAFVLVAACGDDGGGKALDAALDAPVDAEIDAPPTVYSGTLSALEVAVLDPGNTGRFFGQGVQIGVAFQDSVNGVVATMEEQPGSPLGCKLFEYTPAQTAQAIAGNDEGTVEVIVGGEAGPIYPPCTFTTGVGYTCPHPTTFSNGGLIAAGPQAGLWTLTDADVTYNAGNVTNRYVRITGATMAVNNGAFPIVGLANANQIIFANAAGRAELLPETASHVNLAGVGPTPMAPDPGFLGNDVQLSIKLTPGGGNHLAAFTASTGTGSIGDDFSMPMAERIKLNAIPTNGQQFTITCGGDAQNPCGVASGSLLLMYTTDAPTAGLSPFALPLPVTKRVMVRCAQLGSESITVPAPYMAAIMSSGFTRIQATFMRPTLMAGGPPTVNALAGHAITGFTNRAAPPQ